MDKSFILELVTDSCYIDRINMHGNEKYKKYFNEFNDLIENLGKDMPEEEKFDMLNNLTATQGGLEAAYGDKHFIEGFKLGLRIAVETFLE